MVRTPLSLMNVRASASPRTVFRMSRSCGWSSGRILWLSLLVSKMGVPSVPIEPPCSNHKFIFSSSHHSKVGAEEDVRYASVL